MPTLLRRGFLAALGLGALGSTARAAAPTYSLLIPANPGGGWDSTGRALGQSLVAEGLAHRVRYENLGGAAGTIGLAHFATQARGQPHALLIMGAVMLGGIITGKPPVGLDRVRPLARLTNESNVFVLPASSPLADMRELLQRFRAHPDSVRWGGGSRGSTEHIAVHMLARALGVPAQRINYVPFRGGGEAAAAVLGGHVTVGGSGLSEFREHIVRGGMRAVALTSARRLPGWEGVPTLHELGLDVHIGNWRGVCAAGGLDPQQHQRLVSDLTQVLSSPSWRDALDRHGWQPEPLVGEAFETFVAHEFDTLRQVLLRAGLA